MTLYSRAKVGQRIRAIREGKGMSQAAFAEALGLSKGSQSQISQWEGGAVLPTKQTLERIAQLGGVKPEVFEEYPLFAKQGTIGGVLIEIIERFSEHFPKDQVVSLLQELVDELTEFDSMSAHDHAAWDGYLRGAGLIRRAEAVDRTEGERAKATSEMIRTAEAQPAQAPPQRAASGRGRRRP